MEEKLLCPYCSCPAISWARKMYLGSATSAACRSCGKKVTIPYWAMVSVVPFLIALVAIQHTQSLLLQAALVLGSLGAMFSIHTFWVPLVPTGGGKGISLDCSACKTTGTMEATTIPRFNTILRIIGGLIVFPSVLGVGFAVLAFIAAIQTTTALGAGASYGLAIFIGGSALISGLVGWLLVMNRKVYKCTRCNFFLERA